jgi:hypothetical protein
VNFVLNGKGKLPLVVNEGFDNPPPIPDNGVLSLVIHFQASFYEAELLIVNGCTTSTRRIA